jgi:hypothetical protein
MRLAASTMHSTTTPALNASADSWKSTRSSNVAGRTQRRSSARLRPFRPSAIPPTVTRPGGGKRDRRGAPSDDRDTAAARAPGECSVTRRASAQTPGRSRSPARIAPPRFEPPTGLTSPSSAVASATFGGCCVCPAHIATTRRVAPSPYPGSGLPGAGITARVRSVASREARTKPLRSVGYEKSRSIFAAACRQAEGRTPAGRSAAGKQGAADRGEVPRGKRKSRCTREKSGWPSRCRAAVLRVPTSLRPQPDAGRGDWCHSLLVGSV